MSASLQVSLRRGARKVWKLNLSRDSPADFVIDIVSVDYHSLEDEELSKARINGLIESWRHERETVGAGKEGVLTETAPHAHSRHDKRNAKLRKTPFRRAFPTVLARSFRYGPARIFGSPDPLTVASPPLSNLRRQPDVFIARVSNPPFMALFFWIYFAVRMRSDSGPASTRERTPF